MRYRLSEGFVLKWLEIPSLYNLKTDELYELDEGAFRYLRECTSPEGCDADDAEREFIDYCLSEGILTANPADVKRPPVILSPVPSLRYLELQITDKCNLRCRHCYIGVPQNRELSIPELKSVLTEFENMQGLRLLITGGEPLMHSHFAEFNALLPGYAYRKILFTNGLLLDQNLLSELYVDEIQFSIDGMEHGHDTLRGKGTFRKVIKSVEMALGFGIPVSVATMVHQQNRSEFDEMQLPQNRELSIPELKSVLTEFENMQGLRLLITGGDPLMYSHFAEFNALLPEYAYRKILFTTADVQPFCGIQCALA